MNVMLQRYLLNAVTLPVSLPASSNTQNNVQTATIPLGAAWTVRLRAINAVVTPQDNAGSLQIANMLMAWQFVDANNNVLASVLPESSIIPVNPFYNVPHISGVSFVWHGDLNQVVSSFDQGLNGIAKGVLAISFITIVNNDATNPHSAVFQTSAIMEFDDPGSA